MVMLLEFLLLGTGEAQFLEACVALVFRSLELLHARGVRLVCLLWHVWVGDWSEDTVVEEMWFVGCMYVLCRSLKVE